MDPTTAISLVGLAFTISNSAHAFKLQPLEGTKACDNQIIRVLAKDDKVYLKMHNKVHTLSSVPTNKGVTNVRRFENRDRTVAFLQLPEKAMVLDNAKMVPITNDCRNI